MKKNYVLLSLLFLLFYTAKATTYNTITIDGANSGWAADETFDNISHDGNSDPRHAYFTWDADYFYIGIMDVEADYNNMATFIYFDTDPWGNNGDSLAYAWGGASSFITLGYKADYAIVWKNEYGNDYIEVRHYNNGTGIWDFITNSPDPATYIVNGSDTVVKFAIGSDYREVKIKRSLIGNPIAIKSSMFSEQQTGSYYRYFTWPSQGWTDAFRAPGQTIPNYYGFLLEEHYSLDSSVYYDAAFSRWNGGTDNNWSTAANWDNGIPADTTLVVIPSASVVNVDASPAGVFDLSVKSGASVTIPQGGALTVNGGLFNHAGATGIVINSTSAGNGSLIVKGYADDSVTAQCYITASHWHSFATPVSGQTTTDLFLNHSPDVWLLEYDEATDNYTYISSLTQDLGDMQGWMLWLGGTVDHTYSFAGPLRTGTLGSADNLVRSATGDNRGYNFVGNPFTSAINWEATDGWTKTNISGTIYIYDGTHTQWATYNSGDSTNGGTRFIAMNQGFFVQVADGHGSYPEYGTLQMTNDVCVHNNAEFFKNGSRTNPNRKIRLKVTGDTLSDEAVIRFLDDATAGFDWQYDAHKLSSFNENAVSVFSSDNGGMAINSLPPGTETVPIDFGGPNNTVMTLSLTQCVNFDHVFLTDNSEGITVDLKEQDYTFTYHSYQHNRFFIHFTVTDIKTPAAENSVNVYASKGMLNIVNTENRPVDITVYNLLGQETGTFRSAETLKTVPVESNRFYLVKVNSGGKVFSYKIFVP